MFKPSEYALKILQSRYFKDDEDWEDMCKRVAQFLAKDNTPQNVKFYEVLSEGLFLPNTPCLVNAGTNNPQLSACFYLPIEDDMHSIFQTLHDAAQIFKSGGGVGFNFSSLRPQNSVVQSTSGIASGPISFMKIYDQAIEQIKQGGVRRGAAMGMMRVDHPDIIKFIKCKDIDGHISNFNISVAITDKFMNALQSDTQRLDVHVCTFGNKIYGISKTDDTPVLMDEFNGDDRELWWTGDVWDLITKQAWKNGEPGVLFWDEIVRKNGKEIAGVNPCAEQILEDYEACCLGSIDLSKFVIQNEEGCWGFDNKKLKETVCTAVDILNRTIDVGVFPIDQITQKVNKNRKIGIGVMGWADALIKLGERYGSDGSILIARETMQIINKCAHEYSEKMGYKNKTLTTIAPTGSLSIIAGCSGGIEPNHSWHTTFNRKDFGEVTVKHPLAKVFLTDELPSYFVTAEEVKPLEHIAMQAAFQKHTDNAVSKTINFGNDVSQEEIAKAIKYAWHMKCKGLTVYRDGSRSNQVISKAGSQKSAPKYKENLLTMKRPYMLSAKIFKEQLDIGASVQNVYIIIGLVNNRPYEIFVHGNIRDIDQMVANFIDTTTRLVSLSMKNDTPLNKIIEQLKKVPGTMIYSLPTKIASVLENFLEPEERSKCPKCNNKTIFTEGCEKCSSCGWSRCG